MSIFWSNVLSLMKDQKKRKKDIIQRGGFHGSTFHTWVKRDVLPQVDDALKIADLLGVSVRYLVTGSDDALLPPHILHLVDIALELSEAEVSWLCDQVASYRILEHRKKGEVGSVSGTVAG